MLQLPPYQPLPPPDRADNLHQVPVARLQPTQLCVGLAEIRSRQNDFREETPQQRLRYLATKPVPLARSGSGELWMIDRHHRLRALVEMAPDAEAYAYIVLQLEVEDRQEVLAELQARGWLYLHDGRGNGPLHPTSLPNHLADLQDDPYRSLVWKLKKERLIDPEPLIPFHEFRWGAWLRSRSLPPFSSLALEPALPAARALVRSRAASHLAGWTGGR